MGSTARGATLSGFAFMVVTLRFLLELGAIGALVWSAARAPVAWPLRIAGAIASPLAVALVWGSYVAPRAPWRIRGWARLVPELAVFFSAAAALIYTGYARTGWSFAVVALVDAIADHFVDEEKMRSVQRAADG